jgi:polyvinyl alcohol dehydrogenase (cytochrome)
MKNMTNSGIRSMCAGSRIKRAAREIRQSVAIGAMLLLSGAAFAQCDPVVDLSDIETEGWGLGHYNQRLQTRSDINPNNVSQLKLKWAVSLGKKADHHSMPLVTSDTVYVGTQTGLMFALDKETGCERFVRQYDSDIRTAIVHHQVSIKGEAKTLLYFGTGKGSIYSIDGTDGSVEWRVAADVHPYVRVTGSPVLHDGVIYTPVSSIEAAVAAGPTYSCCTFRGSVLALDAATGERKWRSYSINEPARVTGSRLFVLKERGPSGAPIWGTPALDPVQGVLYYGTGENYSLPATDTSDAIIAISLASGERLWAHQFTENDVWNVSCDLPILSLNCPDEEQGHDLDFGAPPIIATSKQHGQLVFAGQKSGMVFAMKPDTGELVWEQRAGRGGKLGGVHWGMAVSEKLNLLFVPMSDRNMGATVNEGASPGLHALDLDTGDIVWSAHHVNTCAEISGCDAGLSAAVMANDSLVFAGGLDGNLYAYDAKTGEVLWTFGTDRSFASVSQEQAHGGAIDVHGPVIAGDMLFVTSGYGMYLQKSGDAFLAFSITPSAVQ